MRRDILFVILFLLFVLLSSLLIPFKNSIIQGTWLTQHIYWAISIALGAFFVAGGVLAIQAVFQIKRIGGNIGIGLKTVACGFILFGLNFIQFPLMDGFNLWLSFYSTSSLFLAPAVLGIFTIILGFFLMDRSILKKGLLLSFLVTLVVSIIAIYFFTRPHPHTPDIYQGRNEFQYFVGLLVDFILIAGIGICATLSVVVKHVFGLSKISDILRILTISFVFTFFYVLVPTYFDLFGWRGFLLDTGIYNILILLGGITFTFFAIRLKNLSL